MKKLLILGMLLAAFTWGSSVVKDHKDLEENLIRLHVVANSDSEEDQKVKLQVRDAVNTYLSEKLAAIRDVDDAKILLNGELDNLKRIAEETLQSAGFSDTVKVTLEKEAFSKRIYDTFTLPSGVYEALRVVIGEGSGHNWWCVVFPGLCAPVTVDAFAEEANQSGLGEPLTNALTGGQNGEVRFFFLECLGRIENFLFEEGMFR